MTATSVAPAVAVRPSRLSRVRFPLGPYFVFVVLIGATIPWRSKTYFLGGIDPVVVIKGLLSLFALGCAVLIAFNRPTRELRSGPVVFLLLYLGITVVGAWSTGYLVPAAIIVIRVLVIATTIILLSRTFEGTTLLAGLVAALATYALVGAVTGAGSLAEGRLSGRMPPLHPNELASISAIALLWCLWRILNGRDTWVHLVAVPLATAILIATASRTPLAAVAVGAVLVVVHARAVRTRTLVVALVMAPALWWVLVGTDFVRNLLLRGDDPAQLTTLSNRTIAWQAAFAPKSSPWLNWFGGGLPMKRIEVPGQPWETQILDSSWVSALVQGGYLGLVLCALWMLTSLFATANSPLPLRAIQLAFLVYLTLRGFLESGLFDASTSFLLFFTVVMATPMRSARNGNLPGGEPIPVLRPRVRVEARNVS